MKGKVFTTVLVAGLAIAVGVASGFAGSKSLVLRANVPFGFTVGDVSLPAGIYTITMQEQYRGGLLIQGTQASQACLIMTHSGNWSVPDGKGKLLFKRYGDEYFLSQVFPAFENTGQKLPVSKMEKEYIVGGPRAAANKSVQPELVVTSGQ
jgi:hypothetical protein